MKPRVTFHESLNDLKMNIIVSDDETGRYLGDKFNVAEWGQLSPSERANIVCGLRDRLAAILRREEEELSINLTP